MRESLVVEASSLPVEVALPRVLIFFKIDRTEDAGTSEGWLIMGILASTMRPWKSLEEALLNRLVNDFVAAYDAAFVATDVDDVEAVEADGDGDDHPENIKRD